VDSPSGPLDPEFRRAVAPVIPRVTPQFIGLILATEKAAFVNPLRKECAGIQYLTVVPPDKLELADGVNEDAVERGADGSMLISDTNFFDNYQYKEDD